MNTSEMQLYVQNTPIISVAAYSAVHTRTKWGIGSVTTRFEKKTILLCKKDTATTV